jgi:hypothetical protein
MWYKVDWAEANSLGTTRTEHIEATDLVEALKLVAEDTLLVDLAGCCFVVRVAGPPSEGDES